MGYMQNGLTFNTLRSANRKRLPMFKDKQGRLCHTRDDAKDWTPSQWMQAVMGELGELANLRKKIERGDFPPEKQAEVQQMLADEIADVGCYLDLLALCLDIDLGAAVMHKWNEISKRVGAPLYIDAEDWHCTPEYRP